MGLFISYCKKCNNSLNWFFPPKYGFIQCRKCDTYNTFNDLCESQNKKNYWKVLERRKKNK